MTLAFLERRFLNTLPTLTPTLKKKKKIIHHHHHHDDDVSLTLLSM